MRRCQTGSKFQLNELFKRDGFYAVDYNCRVGGIGKRNRFGQTVAREFAGRHYINRNILLRRSEFLFRAFKCRTIAEANQLLSKSVKSIFGKKYINIYSEPLKTMLV